MRVLGIVVVVLASCINAQHAEVPLANNPDGADCFARCAQTTAGAAGVACVAACPRGFAAEGDCAGNQACIEDRTMNTTRTTIVVVAAALAAGLLYVKATDGGGDGGP